MQPNSDQQQQEEVQCIGDNNSCSIATEDQELDTCKSAKKAGFSIRSSGSVETIQMQKTQIFTQTAMYKGIINFGDPWAVEVVQLRGGQSFVLKVTDFGLAELHAMEETSPEELSTYSYYKKKLWTAPELLRNPNAPIQGTQKGDVYSFALILHEMLYRKGAFYRGEEESPTPQGVQLMITSMDAELYGPVIPDFSPVDDTSETVKKLLDLMMSCWIDVPHLRPDFSSRKTSPPTVAAVHCETAD
uniref:guanylate cyclase n=1 Tax=Globodera pallida TaxID=36090 RepID=A0A183CM19_GLOPA